MTALGTMSALAVAKENTDLEPLPWRRMAWVTWRQHRTALIGVFALIGALALCLLIVGLRLHHAYSAATACHPANSPRAVPRSPTSTASATFCPTAFSSWSCRP